MFATIVSPIQTPAAVEAVEKVNQAIGQAMREETEIQTATAALVESAFNADPDDAGKLVKALDALKVRKLKALLAEMRIPAIKMEAQAVVREAARAEVERLEAELAKIEKTIDKAANALGYAAGSRQRTQLTNTDPARTQALAAIREARSTMHGFRTGTPDDENHVEALRVKIAALLK